MRISLIVATIGRKDEIRKFLDHISLQTYKNFEVIIVDQNEDDRLANIVIEYQKAIDLKIIKSKKGLSKARNTGLRCANGNIIAFPDDDCWYDCDVIEKVVAIFKENNVDVITGRCVDENGNECMGKFATKNSDVTIYNVWKMAISVTIFMRKSVVDNIGGFDESLGVGADTVFQSGEETDYLIRVIKKGYRIKYFYSLAVNHPSHKIDDEIIIKKRAYFYGCGWGRVLAKNHYSVRIKLWYLFRPLMGVVISGILGEKNTAIFRWQTFKGRLRGITSDY